MKNFFVIFALFCAMFMISCGGGSDSSEGGSGGDTNDSSSCPSVDGNMWSSLSSIFMPLDEAIEYCEKLKECGYSDWKLPTISDLRTLIKNCPGSQTGGACAVSDPDHLSSDDWNENDCRCEYMENNGGYYSKLGDDDKVRLWSSSALSDHSNYWYVSFFSGYITNAGMDYSHYVRCVR